MCFAKSICSSQPSSELVAISSSTLANLSAALSGTRRLPLVMLTSRTSCPCSISRSIVLPMLSTASCGSGLKSSTRFGYGFARSGRKVSSAFGFPPGHPEMVC